MDADAGFDSGPDIDGSRGDGGADASARDAGTSDAALRDAGMNDATMSDSAMSDSGGRDSGAIDVGPGDVGPGDVGLGDAGPGDVGPGDAASAIDANRDGGPEPHPVVEEFLASLASETCAFYARCGLDLSVSLSFFGGGTCEDLIGFSYADQTAPGFRALMAAGTASYDSVGAQACLDAFPTVACADIAETLADCAAVFHGLVADGASCTADEECSTSSYCDDAYGCGNVGVCRPRAALGASCSGGVGCVAGSFCGGPSAVCTAYVDVGGACGPTLQCRFGLACWSGVCGDPSSIPPADVGGACALDAGMRCMDDLVCASDTHTCQPGGVPIGSACHPATPSQCVATAYCGAGNVCRMRAAPGESCAGGVGCMPNSRCGDGSVCIAINRVGGACRDAGYCWSNVCTAMVCEPGRFCD